MLHKINNKILLLLASACLLGSLLVNFYNSFTVQELCQSSEKQLHKKEALCTQILSNVKRDLTTVQESGLFNTNNSTFFNTDQVAVFVYKGDSLKYWSTEKIAMGLTGINTNEKSGIVHLRNGWFEYLNETGGPKNDLQIIGMILLKPEYDIQNNYLSNNFPTWLGLPSTAKIIWPVTDPNKALHSQNGKALFEVDTDEPIVKNKALSNASAILFFIFLLMGLMFVLRYALTRTTNWKLFTGFWTGILALRIIMVVFKWPAFLYSSAFFDLSIFANAQSFFNGYLGDMVLNAILFLIMAIIFCQRHFFNFDKTSYKIAGLVIYFAFLVFLALQLTLLVKSLVTNSTISFDFLNFFNLSVLSFVGLGIVFIYGLTIALFTDDLLRRLKLLGPKKMTIFLTVVTLLFIGAVIMFRDAFPTAIQSLWLVGFVAVSSVLNRFYEEKGILNIGLRVLIFAIMSTWLFNIYNLQNDEQNVKTLSDVLSDKQDPILESEFNKISKKLQKNVSIRNLLMKSLFKSEIEQQIRQKYFNGYFEKYNIQLALFDSLCMPQFRNSNLLLGNNDYFEEQINSPGTIFTFSEDLYLIGGYKLNSRYVGKVNFYEENVKRPLYTLYVQMEPKQLVDEGGFPEILLDKAQQKQNQYRQFSYAIYRQNKLSVNNGDFNYPLYFKSEKALNDIHSGFIHNFYSPDEDGSTRIVITTESKDMNYYFTLFSYHFLFYTILLMLVIGLYYMTDQNAHLVFSLNRRIQLFVISILFFALLAVGVFSVKLFAKKFEEDRVKQLIEKNKRLINELSPLVFNTDKLNKENRYYAESVLKRFALLFDSEITVYDKFGNLFSASRPEIFDLGLNSEFINPMVITNFSSNKASYFITRDNIGTLNYLSFYTTVYNSSGVFLGYINLPYFSRQSDLEKELSDYFATLLNIYVVLFLVSLLTGLIVSAYITKPLRIVQQQFAKVALGVKNEPILWESNDEIGKLVNEYNEMLIKLENSAILLARSEREGAWREMAKQVAHEIKNPLTPMKLNLQYLQKTINDNSTDFKERFAKVSASIIEQIDTLAHIAGEFSNFANMPKVQLQEINLTDIINSATSIFQNQENTSIKVHSFSNEVKVIADKEQGIRIFNNLIKNAVQSIPDGKNGEIIIDVTDSGDMIRVSITDNGSGIPDNMKQKIFTPNFTTKSTGTGLGLAMVKNIMDSFNGTIRFESTENLGTTFYLTFRKV